ncbi:MAG: hypothetical protein O7C67_09775 [Gammaproteobacteria bacterium]|nr:hypothetical protein [Gammaproteobacteria bacterium]
MNGRCWPEPPGAVHNLMSASPIRRLGDPPEANAPMDGFLILLAFTYSRVTELPEPGYRKVTALEAATYPNLGETDQFNTARIFHWNASQAAADVDEAP